MEFTKKIKVPIGGALNLTYEDFDFFGEFCGITPKTPTYVSLSLAGITRSRTCLTSTQVGVYCLGRYLPKVNFL